MDRAKLSKAFNDANRATRSKLAALRALGLDKVLVVLSPERAREIARALNEYADAKDREEKACRELWAFDRIGKGA